MKKEYQDLASDFLVNKKDKDTLELVREGGDIVRYNPVNNYFGVTDKDGVIRTFYKPNPKDHGLESNLAYFYKQK